MAAKKMVKDLQDGDSQKGVKKADKTPGEKYYDEEGENTEAKETAPRKPEDGKTDERWAVKSKKVKKADEDIEDEGEDDGDMDKGRKVKKSITQADLAKSLQGLASFIDSNDSTSRKDSLLEQAREGSLSKSEREELIEILGGGSNFAREASLGETVTKSFDESEPLQKAIDVSDYLGAQHAELVKSLQQLGDFVEASDSRQSEFNLLLAKAVSDVGGVVKSMGDRLGVIESQPARQAKSRGVAPLNKSFVGQTPAGETLSKSQILDAMTDMNQQSFSEGRNGLSKSGHDLTKAVAKYEQSQMLSPGLRDEVTDFIRAQRSAR